MKAVSARIWGWLIASLIMPALVSTASAQETLRFPVIIDQSDEASDSDQDSETSQLLRFFPRQEEEPQDPNNPDAPYGMSYPAYLCLVDKISVYGNSIGITCSADEGPLGESISFSSSFNIENNAYDIVEARDMIGHVLQLYQIGLDISDDQQVILRIHVRPVRGQVVYPMRWVSLDMNDYRGNE